MRLRINFLKIGKYGRPIFWAGIMSMSLYVFIKIISNFFTLEGQEFLQLSFSSFGDIIFGIFILLVLLLILTISVYKVTHPYISKDGYDEIDEMWGIGLFIAILIIIFHTLLQYFFDFDLLDYIFPPIDIDNLIA